MGKSLGNGQTEREVERLTPEEARKVIRKQFAFPIEACRQLEEWAGSVTVPWAGRVLETPGDGTAGPDDIVALELARSTKTYAAAMELSEHGFGEQAAMLNRSLFEGMAVAHWVHANETEAAARFNDAYEFDRHLSAVLMEQVGWAASEDAEAIADAKLTGDELAKAEDAFGRYGERMWTGHKNLRALVKDIEDQWNELARRDLWQFVEVPHRDNNLMLHSTVSGLTRSLRGFDDEGGRFWIGPSNLFLNKAFFGSYWNYSNLLTLVADRFDLGDLDELNAMIGRHRRAFIQLTPEDVRGVGRNDLCPCESGRKYKKCHEDQVTALASLAAK